METKLKEIQLSKEELMNILLEDNLDKELFEDEITEIYQELKKQMDCVLFAEVKDKYCYVIISLGENLDLLLDSYMQSENLMKGYFLDVMAQKILEKVSKELEKILNKENLYIMDILFPGDRIPIEQIAEIFSICKPEKITYNSSYMMKPLKTLAMIVEVSGCHPKKEFHMCDKCTSTTCSKKKKHGNNMELNYGYQRIFKK